MVKLKLALLRRVKTKFVSVVQKIVPRHRPIPDFWEGFSDVNPVSPVFSFTATPQAAYSPGTHHDGSRLAGYESSSYSQKTVASSSGDVLSSLLAGLPEPPVGMLRRKPGRTNLRSTEYSDQTATRGQHQIRGLQRRQAQRNLRSCESLDQKALYGTRDLGGRKSQRNLGPRSTWIRQESVRVHGAPSNREMTTFLQQAGQVENTRESRDEIPIGDSGQRNGPRAQRSVSEAVNAAVFSSSPSGADAQSQSSTDTEPWPILEPDSRFSSSSSLEGSIIRRPQTLAATNFALGSDVLPDPFVAQPAPVSMGPAPNQGSRQLWSEWSSSSNSRPSPVYLGDGRYRLPDGTIHEITPAFHSTPEEAEPKTSPRLRSLRGQVQSALRQLQFTVRESVGFSSQASREALEGAVEDVDVVVTDLIDRVEAYTCDAETVRERLAGTEEQLAETRRQLAEAREELAKAGDIIQLRDEQIHRLLHPSLYGEGDTPPLFTPSPAAGHSSVLRISSGHQVQGSPTPGGQAIEQSDELTANSTQPGNENGADQRQNSTEATTGPAPPSYHGSLEPRASFPQAMTPDTRVRDDPPSSQSGQSDNLLLQRTPQSRQRSL